jgi:molecular chaperone GrpE
MKDDIKNGGNGKDDLEHEDEVTQLTPEEELAAEELGETASLQKKLKETEDKYLRSVAELDNFRKRMSKEKEDLALFTSEKLLRELLEVKDHLEMALSHAPDTKELKGLRDGVDLTLKQLKKFLEKFGVQEAMPLGELFNPAFHEAIQEEESAQKPGTIVQVYQKGYLFHGRLLRAARVAVAKEKG